MTGNDPDLIGVAQDSDFNIKNIYATFAVKIK